MSSKGDTGQTEARAATSHPPGEPKIRPIDHLVLPVTTLTLARSRLSSLGFRVAPDARHSFGTGNCCVFFRNRTYLEPITILDRSRADMAAAEGMTFVKRLKRFTERQGEGFAMLALKSDDAEADGLAFAKAGSGAGTTFRFTRVAKLPEGAEKEVGFVLAFTEQQSAPDATFFVCQHLSADIIFQPPYLEHPNGALGISAVSLVAESPAVFRTMLATAIGESEIRSSDLGLEVEQRDQALHVLTRDGFRSRYEFDPPNPRRGLLFAAVEISVLDLDQAAGYAGSSARWREERVVVPPAPGLGTVIAFRRERNV